MQSVLLVCASTDVSVGWCTAKQVFYIAISGLGWTSTVADLNKACSLPPLGNKHIALASLAHEVKQGLAGAGAAPNKVARLTFGKGSPL